MSNRNTASPEGGLDFDIDVEGDDDFNVGSSERGIDLEPFTPPLESPTLPDEDEKPLSYLDNGFERDDPAFDPAAEDDGEAANSDDDDDDEEDTPSRPTGDPLADQRAALDEERAQLQRDAYVRQAHSDMAVAKAHRDAAHMAVSTIEAQIRQTREAIAAARESGDTYREVDLQGNLEDLRSAHSNVQNQLGQIPDDNMIRSHAERLISQIQAPQRKAETSSIQALTGLAGKWTQNNEWMSDGRFGAERDALVRFNDALVAEKYDPESPEFYSEITRRMARSFPELRVRGLDGRTGAAKKPSPNSGMQVANPRSGARRTAPGTSNRERVQISSDDKRMARELGIDLSDKEMLAEFASNKMSRMKSETSSRRR